MKVSDQLQAPAALPFGKIPNTIWIGDWMGPKSGLSYRTGNNLVIAGLNSLTYATVS